MNRRPLCWLLICFAVFIGLLEFLGVTHGGSPPGNQKLQKLASKEAGARAEGLVERCETKGENSYLYLKSANLAISAETFSNLSIRIRTSKEKIPEIGSRVQVQGYLYEMPKASNPGQFDMEFYYRIQGIDLLMEGENWRMTARQKVPVGEFLHRIRERLKETLVRLAPGEAGELSAMLLGEKSLLEEDTKQLYKMMGIYHILAISGTHLTLIGMGVLKLLGKAGMGIKAASVLSGAVMVFYGIFTGSSVSTSRAVLMFLLCAGARVIGRTYDMLSALALSGILILAENPGYLYHSGFLLSYLAVAGLGIFTPAFGKKKNQGRGRWIREGLAGGMAVFLAQFPILQYFFYEIPLFSLAVNLLVIPLLPVVLTSGFLGVLAGLWIPNLGRILLLGAVVLLRVYEGIGRILGAVPVSSLVTGQPALWQAGIYYILLIVLLAMRTKISGKWFALGLLGAALFLCVRPGGGFRFVMLDVGQGDCLALETPGDHFFLVDGGSSSVQQVGSYRILPFIKQSGVGKIEGIFVTHGDEDHISGVLEILEEMKKGGGVRVKRLFLPQWMRSQEDQKLQETAKKAGAALRYLQKGDVIRDGEVVFRILYPDEKETGEDPNSGSLTMKVEYGKLNLLLTGDLSGEGEKRVAEETVNAQVLKVAHHGSASSTEESFLEQVSPSFALISCGENNRYGHPSDEVIQRLKEREVMIYDTRYDGAVSLSCDKEGRLEIETFIDKREKSRYR